MNPLRIEFMKLRPEAIQPRNAYSGDAGWDLFSVDDVVIDTKPIDVKTGIAVSIPEGHYGRIIHRSSAPRKFGIMVIEGIIDAGFRGELFFCAISFHNKMAIPAGTSLAQLIVQPFAEVSWYERGALSESARGAKGFGSSGSRIDG